MKILAKRYNFLKYNADVAVMAVAPASTRSFCQFRGMELKNIELKCIERSDKRVNFDMRLFTNLSTGFLSKTVSNNPITSFCYVAI